MLQKHGQRYRIDLAEARCLAALNESDSAKYPKPFTDSIDRKPTYAVDHDYYCNSIPPPRIILLGDALLNLVVVVWSKSGAALPHAVHHNYCF